KAIIIEDERLIAEEFKRILTAVSGEMEIIGSFSTVKESIEYLSANELPDLIFSDVQLPDGTSFDIFNKVNIDSPVIFVTAYDNYIVNAFEHNGIDYLLKPVDERDVAKAIARYKTLEKHFNGHQSFVSSFLHKPKTRLIARRGLENVAIKMDDIVMVYTENKVVYVMDKEGKKYIGDRNLSDLYQQLDSQIFFRANRQYIINIAFIKSYKTYEKVKLQVDLTLQLPTHQIIISQETAPGFRKWMNGD
ncbi:MAG TPA: LytTR family DNA-binding domain-containing protein, partial [Chitinophagaceae bacterium]